LIRLNEEESRKLINDVLDERKKRNIPKWIRENPEKYYELSWFLIFILGMSLAVCIGIGVVSSNQDTQSIFYIQNIKGKLTGGDIALQLMSCGQLKSLLVDLQVKKPEIMDIPISDIQIMIQGKC